MTVPTTEELLRKKCTACEGEGPPMPSDQARALLVSVPGWRLSDDGTKLQRTWVARNFQAGIDFFNEVAALAEGEGHHPDLHLEGYRNVSIDLTTHAIGGLSENDFILAAKIHQLPISLRRVPHGGGADAEQS